MKTVCYIEIKENGEVNKIYHVNKSDLRYVIESYTRAITGQSKIYAVWPGNYSSDLFVIDDLNEFAAAFKII